MKTMRLTVAVLCAGVLTAQPEVVEFQSKVGTTAANFLKIGVGPRAIGMGEAFVALADDPSGVFWNPAGLVHVERLSAVTGYTDWLADLSLQVGAVAFPSAVGNFALSFSTLQMDDIGVTTVNEPEGTGARADAFDLAVGASYARKLTDVFSLGVTIKYIHSSVANEAASAQAVDIGTLFSPGWRGLRVGMSLTNFGTKMRLDGRDLDAETDLDPLLGSDVEGESRLRTRDWDLPTAFRLGVAADLVNSPALKVTATADGIHATDNVERVNVGLEATVMGLVYLRGGAGINYDQPRYAFGVGSAIGLPAGLRLDYSLSTLDPFAPVQSLAIGLEF